MANNGGITIAGGIKADTTTLIVAGATVVLAGVVGINILGKRKRWHKKNGNGGSSMWRSYAVRSYAVDSSPAAAEQRLITSLQQNATNPTQVSANMDRVRGVIASHRPNITAIAEERRRGEIDADEYNQKLMELLRELARMLGISLRDLRYGGPGGRPGGGYGGRPGYGGGPPRPPYGGGFPRRPPMGRGCSACRRICRAGSRFRCDRCNRACRRSRCRSGYGWYGPWSRCRPRRFWGGRWHWWGGGPGPFPRPRPPYGRPPYGRPPYGRPPYSRPPSCGYGKRWNGRMCVPVGPPRPYPRPGPGYPPRPRPSCPPGQRYDYPSRTCKPVPTTPPGGGPYDQDTQYPSMQDVPYTPPGQGQQQGMGGMY